MKITSNFDSGNIDIVSIDANEGDIKLKIRRDTHSEFFQWFHFRLSGALGQTCTLSLLNAGESSYPKGWEGYQACASYDREEWFRIPTTFENGVLQIRFTPVHDAVYFAYFAPYSYERHLDLVHQAQQSDQVRMEIIGETYEGRPIEMLIAGLPDDSKKKIWIIARQHPGESMTEWFMEGLLERLLNTDDPVARKLLQEACFYIIPNMNIDGAIAGNLRASASGVNLNREWETPSLEKSPEVYHTLRKMDETGVDLMLDVHGDEVLPYNFISASEGIPGYNDYIRNLERKFIEHWMDISPDFQDTYKYELDKPGEANLTICTNQVAQRFGCPAYTIEMPFKDNADMPDELYGWSDNRSAILGASVLNPILFVLKDLK
ncbi:M14 family metallopeptidase [Taibaiella chishuiensis]|uniref:Murein tripeptide amidase MpaA n=1 Tax=Taibaiella chishuiensis TaxID=1434707 RepID=A0A2P8CXQ5_9BACT|nr:M14-type cytosolic carboxypeptidase [Taibaiella chishuiensis]PSK89740.1 murein tripeptide amidase MpaA [Taibaiella chishuiensis]